MGTAECGSGENGGVKGEANRRRSLPLLLADTTHPLLHSVPRLMRFLLFFLFSLPVLVQAAEPKDEFLGKWRSQIGKTVTVTGRYNAAAKFGGWISFDGWGAYVYTRSESPAGLQAEKSAGDLHNRQIKITGPLRHQPAKPSATGRETGIPEHFYFDPVECKFEEAGSK
jgi:hypothetical protein